jgi:hypothetical protein
MKKNTVLFLLFFLMPGTILFTYGQATAIFQNFDVGCATNNLPAQNWNIFSPVTANWPNGSWTCAMNSKNNTPCMECSGFFDGSYHLDTSFLFTVVNFSSSIGLPLYLQFDAKATKIQGSKLSLLTSPTSDFNSPTDISSGISPILGPADSIDWTTHEYNLEALKTAGTNSFGFRYVSQAGSGSVWYIDNVRTTHRSLKAGNLTKDLLALVVLGSSTPNQLVLSYSVQEQGSYNLVLSDMVGRIIHSEMLSVKSGAATYTISGLNLTKGLYVLKMSNESSSGVAKAVIQ